MEHEYCSSDPSLRHGRLQPVQSFGAEVYVSVTHPLYSCSVSLDLYSGYREDNQCVIMPGSFLGPKSLTRFGRSYIIESLQQQRSNGTTGTAYVYFSYKDAEIQTPTNIVASILQQLITLRSDYLVDLKDLYTKHKKENTRPSLSDMMLLLQSVVFSFSKVFLVIDALDECSDADDVRSILLRELKKLQSRLCLLVMSRPIPDMEFMLEGAVRVTIEPSMTDIENYLQQRLEGTRSMQKHLADEPSLRDTIISRITQKIKGM
jgi:hypothetical protein